MLFLLSLVWLVLVVLAANRVVATAVRWVPNLDDEEQQLIMAIWVTAAGLTVPLLAIVVSVDRF